MHRTIEAILHSDGTLELLEPLPSQVRRRVLVTILDESPAETLPRARTDAEQFDAALRTAGLLDETDDLPADGEPLSSQARAALAQRNAYGTPLSQIIIEDREERF